MSYFEWVQNLMHYYWSEQEVNEKLQTAMVNAYRSVAELAEKYKVDLRTGAYMISLLRIKEAMEARGWI